MEPILEIAVRAARAAGDLIISHADSIESLEISSKGLNDFVSEVDKKAEQVIVDILLNAYPNHAILGEEGGHQGRLDGEFTWVIDPLDGTTNFLHGFPQFAVSIALLHKSRIECGVIYDPVRQELFAALREGGATLNNRRLRVTQRKSFAGALLGTGLPVKDQNYNDAYFGMLRALMKDSAGIRRGGAAALDLAWVACGRIDGFWEIGLQPWDIAAGVLLIQESGGIVTDFEGSDGYMANGDILTGNPTLHALMEETIQPFVAGVLRQRDKLIQNVNQLA